MLYVALSGQDQVDGSYNTLSKPSSRGQNTLGEPGYIIHVKHWTGKPLAGAAGFNYVTSVSSCRMSLIAIGGAGDSIMHPKEAWDGTNL